MVHKRFNPQLSVSTQIPVVSMAGSQNKKKSRFHVTRRQEIMLRTIIASIKINKMKLKCFDSYCLDLHAMILFIGRTLCIGVGRWIDEFLI
jgi:hypothetical protein